jgi:hypothetical protein
MESAQGIVLKNLGFYILGFFENCFMHGKVRVTVSYWKSLFLSFLLVFENILFCKMVKVLQKAELGCGVTFQVSGNNEKWGLGKS